MLLGIASFRAVQDRFTGEPRVTFHRQFSYRAVTAFPDRHFDFVYIDGNHGYEYVLRDLGHPDFARRCCWTSFRTALTVTLVTRLRIAQALVADNFIRRRRVTTGR